MKDVLLVAQGRLGFVKYIKIREEWKNESLFMNGAITECGENICWDINNYQEDVNPKIKISKNNKLLNCDELENGNIYVSIRVIESDNKTFLVEVFDILKV